MGILGDVFSNPGKAFTSDLTGGNSLVAASGNDVSNIGNAAVSLVQDPSINNIKNITAQTLANPGASAIAGAALVASGVGAPLAAAIVGGTDALATGSISKGLMSGIGAYGGANIIGDVAAGGANYNADVASASNNYDYTSNYANNLAAGVSNPSAVLAAAGPGGVASDALHLGATALQAGSGPNGNALLPNSIQSSMAATPTSGGSGISSSTYNRNPYSAKDLNLIGAQYTQGENPDTSERRYFNPTYSTPDSALGITPQQAAQLMTATPTATTPAGAGTTNQVVSKAAMGGLQATPQAQMVNTPNPNAPMSHDLVDAYHRPQVQMPVPQPVMMASGGASDPMNYSSDPVTNLPADQIYAINPATHTPYAQDIAQSGLSGNGLAALIAQENAAKAAAQQSIAQDTKAASTGGSMGTSVNAYADGGGIYNLGGYSDGGRLLRGPGDGVSDSIPATIGHKQPARLADGEFVVPARHVSELGNGSTEAGARKLYAMLDRIQSARAKTVGKKKGSIDSKADKYLPA